MTSHIPTVSKTYVVEHLDPELEEWSSLEYASIAKETLDAGSTFLLTSVQQNVIQPLIRANTPCKTDERSVEEIFHDTKDQVCLLDPAAQKELSPEDANRFNVYLFGGILGDDPPRDRTSELRKKGFEGRRLGPIQMTTDTAVRVTRMVVQDRIPLDQIQYVDHPKLEINRHESTQMPFRYVKGSDDKPVMPEGMLGLIQKGSDVAITDLL